ncbi:MAG: histidine--tRNA ligase [Bacilli bacterium]|nr:histidine--tRNA ligase [Bacilli bacterium]
MKIQNVKGSMDYLPEEQIIRNKVINTLSNTFEEYGYLPVETTTLCYYDLLASKYAGGAEILKEVYKLNDQGERNLALRYDLTVPFSKIIAMNKGLNLPFRRYEIGKVFRDGPVKVGRNREFYQCDVDVCGIEGQYVEAELFSMAFSGYNKLGIDIYIEWNNRKFLSGLILESGIEEALISPVILSVDKLAKIGEDGVKKELESYNISKNSLDKLFSYFKINISDLKSTFEASNNSLLKEGIEEIINLDNYLNGLGLNEAKFTPYLARGLEIYTGTVWEVFDKNQTVTCAIGAGGRYDRIITNFINDGNTYPAVGMSFGLVPICEILNKNNEENTNSLYDLYIVPMSLDEEIEALKLANALRNKDIKVMIEMKKRKIKKCMEWANKNNIGYVIVIGSDEVKSHEIEIKDMNNYNTNKVSIDDIDAMIDIIKK